MVIGAENQAQGVFKNWPYSCIFRLYKNYCYA